MTKIKRRFNAGAVFALVLLTLTLSIYVVASPSSASLEVRFPVAQSDIPNVLVPSVVPSAEPTFAQNTPTPLPAKVSANVSKNTTQNSTNSTGKGFDLGKIVGSISPFFIIALIPLLFVIGALFYFFFMGAQERGVSDEDQEAEVELSNADDDTGWREL